MILKSDQLKEGCILVMSSGLMLQVIRYSLTEIKFRFLYVHSFTELLPALFLHQCNIRKRNSLSPDEFIFKSIEAIPRTFTYKFCWQKFDDLRNKPAPHLALLLRYTAVVIADKEEIKKIKALVKKVMPNFAVIKLYNGSFTDLNADVLEHKLYLRYHNHAK